MLEWGRRGCRNKWLGIKMAVSHVFSNAVANWTGTVTVFNSQGSTGTVAATDLVRPTDWNSAHNQFYTLTGNTNGNSTASGTNVIFAGSGGVTLGGSTDTIVISGPVVSAKGNILNGVVGFASSFSITNSLAHIIPFRAEAPFAFSLVRFYDRVTSVATAGNNSSAYVDLGYSFVIYSRNVSTLSSVVSGSSTFSASWSSNATATVRGLYNVVLTVAQTTLPAGEYWIAKHFSTTNTATGGANTTALANTVNYVGVGLTFEATPRSFGSATNATYANVLGNGSIGTTQTRATIAFSDVSSFSGMHAFDLLLGTVQ